MDHKNKNTHAAFDRDRMEAFLKTLSPQDFLEFGMRHVAYVKPVRLDGENLFAIHAADGTPLSISESFDSAVIMLKDNDLEAVTVH